MRCNNCCGDPCSTCIEVVISIVLAAVVGVLFIYGLIPDIVTGLWILFGLAVLNLVFLVTGLYTASIFRRTPLARCLRCRGTIFLAGIIGTIFMTLVLLSITTLLPTLTILITILVSIGAFFAALMGVELVLFISCLINGLRPWREEE